METYWKMQRARVEGLGVGFEAAAPFHVKKGVKIWIKERQETSKLWSSKLARHNKFEKKKRRENHERGEQNHCTGIYSPWKKNGVSRGY